VAHQRNTRRCRLDLRGQVQGVGFRPYVFRLATARDLRGFVANNSNGAVIEIEGPPSAIDAFEHDLMNHLPPLARISEVARSDQMPLSEPAFRIRVSEDDPARRPEVTPDAATCQDCLRELLDPGDRRFRYPFINCTNCGPRYSIIRTVPYDRPYTTMAVFQMCTTCAAEYKDPADRRFHAQPNACPVCGPQLRLHRVVRPSSASSGGAPPRTEAIDADPIREAARLLLQDHIVAVKGIGGYHLACRADHEDVVHRLRQRKLRDGKPLAVMVADLEAARRLVRLSPAEEDALTSVAAPIVLATTAADHALAPSVAPGCPDVGVMLPYSPVHHLLFSEGLGPLVMTSANLAGVPLTYLDDDALINLSDVADAFLTHDREIFRPIDDSVVLVFRDEPVPIRRARGYAPRPIRLAGFEAAGNGDEAGPLHTVRDRRILAVGGELKSTACLLTAGEAVLSEHLGDLSRPEAYRHFIQAIERLRELCGFEPDTVACDLHPQYLSTEYARQLGLPVVPVQHHHAHIASVMAEWGVSGPLIGLACDGTGFGTDRAVWGCEVLLCERGGFERLGHLEYFPLVGGDAAAIETWRPAAALLREAAGEEWMEVFAGVAEASGSPQSPAQLQTLDEQARQGLNAPATSSLGRVFDAVAYLLGLCDRNRHEAEAAMALEAAAATQPAVVEPLAYDVELQDDRIRLSLGPAVLEIVRARQKAESVSLLAARFHETVAGMLADAASLACRQRSVDTVALSGGCFANRRLLTRLMERLEAGSLTVLHNRHIPSGDGGVALGQALVAAWHLAGPGASGG